MFFLNHEFLILYERWPEFLSYAHRWRGSFLSDGCANDYRPGRTSDPTPTVNGVNSKLAGLLELLSKVTGAVIAVQENAVPGELLHQPCVR